MDYIMRKSKMSRRMKPGHVIKQELKLEKERIAIEEVKQREQEKINKNSTFLGMGKKILTYKSNRDVNR